VSHTCARIAPVSKNGNRFPVSVLVSLLPARVSSVPKSSDFGTVLEATRFPQNKRLTLVVSRGFSEPRNACDFLSLGSKRRWLDLTRRQLPPYSVGTGPTDSRITSSALSKSDWISSKAGRGKSRSPGAMARSVFKRAVKMGIKEVRKSIAGLAMKNPWGKLDFNISVAMIHRGGLAASIVRRVQAFSVTASESP
jgi:hypothetical protein